MAKQYDLIVIGTGPAGEKAAVKAAYFGKKVAIIEKSAKFGGAMAVTGTLPSKTLKETALYFSGKYEKGLYGVDRELQRETSLEDFMYRKNFVTKTEAAEVKNNLKVHRVDIYYGTASFIDSHTIKVGEQLLEGQFILIATGSYPFQPKGIPFDNKRIHDSDTILEITRFPKSICIVGAGVIGCEYATIFATIGTKVFLINNREKILPFVDQEVSEDLVEEMRLSGISILFNTSIKDIMVPERDEEMLNVSLENGEQFEVDMFLFAAGRSGQIQGLNCEKIGLKLGKRNQILVDRTYKTNIDHVYAAGDVIGFPALASTSFDQGRAAVAHMFHTKDLEYLPQHFPYGIYTIPEVSMVGLTEEEAKEKGIDYCASKARYSDMARGKILGAKYGFLKMIFDRDTLTIVGVHIIGHLATEIIHYGLALVEEKKNLYDVINTVFNYPTLHDLYKYAAYDGLSTITGVRIKP